MDDGERPRPRDDRSASPLDLTRVGRGHGAVVHDPRLRHEERGLPRGVGLVLPQLRRADASHPHEAVRAAASFELVEPRQLGFGRCHDDLSAPFEGDAVLFAEALEQPPSAGARPRLRRPRLVVEPCVDDAAVAPRLVRGDARFLLEHHHVPARSRLQERQGGSKAHDPAAHDGGIHDVGRHGAD
jgi:hypothetical protein